MIDVARERSITPGVAHVVHLNNAGSALAAQPTLDATISHLQLEAEIGGYEAAAAASDQLERAYTAVAELIGARRHEIALVENATRAWDMAFYSLGFGPGDRILTSAAEYASNVIALLQVAERTGAEVVVIPNDPAGAVSTDALDELLDERVKLVAVTHVPTQGGLVNPVGEIGRLTRAAGVPYLVDACQSAGQLHLDVNDIGCDFLSATGRKFLRGPRGTGFLYVREERIAETRPPFLDLWSAAWTGPASYTIDETARRFETFESNVAGRIGLGTAVDHALRIGLPAIEDRVTELASSLRSRLDAVAGVEVHDLGDRRCALVTFSIRGVDSTVMATRLRDHAVNVSVTLREFAQFDLAVRDLPDLVRASVHYYNTDDELDRLVAEVDAATRGTLEST